MIIKMSMTDSSINCRRPTRQLTNVYYHRLCMFFGKKVAVHFLNIRIIFILVLFGRLASVFDAYAGRPVAGFSFNQEISTLSVCISTIQSYLPNPK